MVAEDTRVGSDSCLCLWMLGNAIGVVFDAVWSQFHSLFEVLDMLLSASAYASCLLLHHKLVFVNTPSRLPKKSLKARGLVETLGRCTMEAGCIVAYSC